MVEKWEKGEKGSRGERWLAGWSRGIAKFVELSTLAGCLAITDGRRFRTTRSFRLAITMIPGIERGGERERERRPAIDINLQRGRGRKEGRRVVERREALQHFCLCLFKGECYARPRNHHRCTFDDMKPAVQRETSGEWFEHRGKNLSSPPIFRSPIYTAF